MKKAMRFVLVLALGLLALACSGGGGEGGGGGGSSPYYGTSWDTIDGMTLSFISDTEWQMSYEDGTAYKGTYTYSGSTIAFTITHSSDNGGLAWMAMTPSTRTGTVADGLLSFGEDRFAESGTPPGPAPSGIWISDPAAPVNSLLFKLENGVFEEYVRWGEGPAGYWLLITEGTYRAVDGIMTINAARLHAEWFEHEQWFLDGLEASGGGDYWAGIRKDGMFSIADLETLGAPAAVLALLSSGDRAKYRANGDTCSLAGTIDGFIAQKNEVINLSRYQWVGPIYANTVWTSTDGHSTLAFGAGNDWLLSSDTGEAAKGVYGYSDDDGLTVFFTISAFSANGGKNWTELPETPEPEPETGTVSGGTLSFMGLGFTKNSPQP